MTRIAIIADDLTGALDTASPFACRGLDVRVALDSDAIDAAVKLSPDVIAVSTNSRNLLPDQASAAAQFAAERLQSWQPDLVLKKIDSRLKGNIGPETLAIAQVFQPTRIIAAPAVPDQGRFVRRGHVEGMGVEAALDVATCFIGLSIAVSVPDTESKNDLSHVAETWRPGDGKLFVCARGLAAAFAERFGKNIAPRKFKAASPVIMAIGSRDPVTLKQISILRAKADNCIAVEAPQGKVPTQIEEGSLKVLICSGEMTKSAHDVAEVFAWSVTAEIIRTRPSTLLLTGGDTAVVILRALGCHVLHVGGEAAPGLPWFEINMDGGHRITTISKSGGFGSPDILARLVVPGGRDMLAERQESGAGEVHGPN